MKKVNSHSKEHEPCPSCGRDCEQGWHSCPVCGSEYDSHDLASAKTCTHRFVDAGEFCVQCGTRFIAPLRRPTPRAAFVGSGMALLALVFGLLAWFAGPGAWPDRGGGLLAGLLLMGIGLVATGLMPSRSSRV